VAKTATMKMKNVWLFADDECEKVHYANHSTLKNVQEIQRTRCLFHLFVLPTSTDFNIF